MNSKLVNYTKRTLNSSSRNGAKIDRIVIHHMAGNLSVETIANTFDSRSSSCTYAIGTDGRVGQYVDESRAPWTTCNYYDCDRYAVTIEVANDQIGGEWHVSDKALSKLIELCADVCKRNGISKLNYTGDKKGNLLMHCWYYPTACPGPYLKSKFEYIAKEVNRILNQSDKPKLTVDGVFGTDSTKALQKWLGVPFTPDGVISGQLKSEKKHFPNIVSCTWEGGGSTTVEYLQSYLKGKGHNPKGIDGILGENTIKAWQTFLVKQGYNVGGIDGVFGPASARAMQSYLNR